MNKIKTHRGAAKRFRFSGSGKLIRNSAYRRHILTKKTTQYKRDKRGTCVVAASDQPLIRQMLPNG